jgi:hypothetical protein
MAARLFIVVLGTVIGNTAVFSGPSSTEDIRTLIKQGRGTAAGRAAWDKVVKSGPEILPAILAAMDTPDTVAANWLRTAFDHIVDRERKAGKLDVEALLAFAKDAKRFGRARRLALELVEELRPGTQDKLLFGWLEDPEFRFEAVALVLTEARKLAKRGLKKMALDMFRRAFDSSRDMMQARAAAVGLGELGVTVSVAQHMGFFTDWYIIGPFDGGGQKGVKNIYPPEKQVDLKATLDGQNGKLRWKRLQVKETAPTSGNRHQVLVDLRTKEALGDADDAVAFAYTEFTMSKAGPVEFRGAADDNFTVYVNGKREFGFEEWRNGVRHDRHRFKVNLKEGVNTVLVKICQSEAPNPEPNWEFFLRVVDESGKGLAFTSTLPKS